MSSDILRKLRDLQRLLERESKLYLQYTVLLHDERAAVTKADSEKVNDFATRRATFIDELNGCSAERTTLVSELGGEPDAKLSVVLERYFDNSKYSPEVVREAKHAYFIAQQLKNNGQSAKRETLECNQVVDFAMKMVSGTLSIFRSATENVNRAYSAKGLVKESYNATYSRSEGVLKEA